MKIGFLGTGIMGFPMAKNLLAKSFDVTVWNRTLSKAERLRDFGAKIANDPREAVKDKDIVITMLSEPKAIWALMIDQGVLDSMKKDALWIDSSTVDPFFSKKMANIANKNGLRFLDAPVSGSKVPAEKKELLFLVGGNENDVKEAEPLFHAMGKGYIHGGENGKGSALKMVVNLVLGLNIAAVAEALSLGKSLDIEDTKIMEMLINGPLSSPLLKIKKDKILNREFSPEFPLKWMQKDLGLILKCAQETDTYVPITAVVKEMYQMAKRSFADMDITAIIDLYENK